MTEHEELCLLMYGLFLIKIDNLKLIHIKKKKCLT